MVLTSDQDKYILSLYEETKGSVSQTVKEFEVKYGFLVSRATIRHKWRDAGFELNTHGGLRHGLSERQFKELYNKNDGDITAMMKKTDYAVISLVTLCYKYDLEPKNVPAGTFEKPKQQKYLDHFLLGGT